MASDLPPRVADLLARVGSKLRVQESPAPSPDEEARAAAALDVELREKLPRLGVPRRCVEALAAPHDTAALLEAAEWWRGRETFLLLLGGVGSGKSVAGAHCVLAAARRASDDGAPLDSTSLSRRACFIRASEMARTSLSDYDAADRAAFRSWLRVRLLVIDDLGAERAADAWLSRVEELLDARYGDRLRTVITSNLDGAAFKARYGERIADRIRHDGRVCSSGRASLRVRP